MSLKKHILFCKITILWAQELPNIFSNKAVKTQLMANYINFPNNTSTNRLNIECLLQVIFSIYLKFSVIKLATF